MCMLERKKTPDKANQDEKRRDYERQHKIALLKLLADDPEIRKEFALVRRKAVPQNCG